MPLGVVTSLVSKHGPRPPRLGRGSGGEREELGAEVAVGRCEAI